MSMQLWSLRDGVGATPSPTAQAAASINIALDDNNVAAAAEILRRFNPLERVGIAMQAIELGTDADRMETAMKLSVAPAGGTTTVDVSRFPPTNSFCWPSCPGGPWFVTPSVGIAPGAGRWIVGALALFGAWRLYKRFV